MKGFPRLSIGLSVAAALSACGGGGGSESGAGPQPFVVPAQYFPASYAPFATTHTVANLEGLWVVLMDGRLVYQNLVGVNGSNFREEDQIHSRYFVRLKKRIDQPDAYYIHSCGPLAARDDAVTRTAAATMEIPFYDGPCCSSRYQMDVIDATTIRASHLTGSRTYNSGLNLSWNLSFTLERISDDPLRALAELHDNRTASTEPIGCAFEADGTYLQTQNDSTRQNFREEGRYFAAAAYRPSALDNDFATHTPLFGAGDHIGNMTEAQYDGTHYQSGQSGFAIQLEHLAAGNATSTDAIVLRPPATAPVVDVTLDVQP